MHAISLPNNGANIWLLKCIRYYSLVQCPDLFSVLVQSVLSLICLGNRLALGAMCETGTAAKALHRAMT